MSGFCGYNVYVVQQNSKSVNLLTIYECHVMNWTSIAEMEWGGSIWATNFETILKLMIMNILNYCYYRLLHCTMNIYELLTDSINAWVQLEFNVLFFEIF